MSDLETELDAQGCAGKGDAVVFAVQRRPVQGTRGIYRVNLRHGVSRLRAGQRRTLGIVFHDSR